MASIFSLCLIRQRYSFLANDGFAKNPSAALRFTFVAAAYFVSTPHWGGFARRVPRNAGELLPKPSLWRLFTRASTIETVKGAIEIVNYPMLRNHVAYLAHRKKTLPKKNF
jgi:hypothetical protein